MLSNGTIIDKSYQVVCKIGESENGLLYRARHLGKQCDVMIHQIVTNTENFQMNGDIVDKLKAMSNEHLPQIFDVMWYEGDILFIEEEKKGIPLDVYIGQCESLTYAQTYAFCMQLVDVLVYLHTEQMIVHANVMPKNIIVEPSGRKLWLTNLYIERVLGLGEYTCDDRTSSGFLAPEQYLIAFEHQAVTLSFATDIYCMGCILYYLLTGYAPDNRYDQIIPISRLKLNIESGFQMIIEKMMSYQPDDRFSSAMELQTAIEKCYMLDRRYRRIKRRKRLNVILATALLLLGTGLVAGGIQKNRIDVKASYIARLDKADEYISEMEYYDAREVITDLEDDYPDSLELYQREIECMYMAKDYEDCINRAQTILKNNFPREIAEEDYGVAGDFYHVLAQCCYRTEEYETAQEYIETALGYRNDDYTFYRDYCLILVEQGKVDKAKGELGVALGLDWDAMERMYVEARIAYASENYTEATEKYREVIGEVQDREILQDAYSSCAAAYEKMENFSDEVQILQKAIADFPEEYSFQLQLAQTFMTWGDEENYSSQEYYEEALDLYKKLEVVFPEEYEVRDRIVVLQLKLGNMEVAENQLFELAETFRDKYRVYMLLAYIEDEKQTQLKKKNRDYHQMQKYYEKARKMYTSSLEDYHMEDLEERMAELKEEGWFRS